MYISEQYLEEQLLIEGIWKTAIDAINKAKDAPDAIRGLTKEVSKVRKTGTIIGASVLSALVLRAIYKFHKLRKNQTCKDLHGPQLKACKLKAIDETINILKGQTKHCSMTKNPDKCKNKIDEEIKKLLSHKKGLLK